MIHQQTDTYEISALCQALDVSRSGYYAWLKRFSSLDEPTPYDGDGKADVAVFRRGNGHWYIVQSSDGAIVDKACGLGRDIPVPADYDGDGKADLAVWREGSNVWYIVRSSDGQVETDSLGDSALGDVPMPGDYDGDGKTDIAVWRPSDGHWYVKTSRDNSMLTKTHGQTGDTPVTGHR